MTGIRVIDGLPILDAKRPISLTISKADIAKAATSIKEPGGCAVARACYRELHVKEARVHLSRVYLRTNESNWVRYVTPDNLRREIISFDRGGQFEPCEATLVPAPPSLRLGTVQGRSTKPKTGKKRSRYHRITNVRARPV